MASFPSHPSSLPACRSFCQAPRWRPWHPRSVCSSDGPVSARLQHGDPNRAAASPGASPGVHPVRVRPDATAAAGRVALTAARRSLHSRRCRRRCPRTPPTGPSHPPCIGRRRFASRLSIGRRRFATSAVAGISICSRILTQIFFKRIKHVDGDYFLIV